MWLRVEVSSVNGMKVTDRGSIESSNRPRTGVACLGQLQDMMFFLWVLKVECDVKERGRSGPSLSDRTRLKELLQDNNDFLRTIAGGRNGVLPDESSQVIL
jgi:hypothetical protein